jgi:ABC-type polar amino acid transport system ATPase subunit
MKKLAEEGMTMLCVTHEMGFAREVADRIVFMNEGKIVEQAAPEDFFNHPASERARVFLDQIIHQIMALVPMQAGCRHHSGLKQP